MPEIDPVIRLAAFICLLSALALAILWGLRRVRFLTAAGLALLIVVLTSTAAAHYAQSAGVTVVYNGQTPTFVNLLVYLGKAYGAVFLGLSAVFALYNRYGPGRNGD